MMESESKEAAMENVDTLPPAAAAAAARGEEMAEISAAIVETGHLPCEQWGLYYRLLPTKLTWSCAPWCCA